MPWQQQVFDTALEVDPETGGLAYREVILTVPRQSGKTTLLLVLILLRALGSPRQQIRYTAQTGSDARKKWMDDWLPILRASKFSSQFHPRLTNGHEALIFNNGSHQGLVATTKKSGHGGTLDLCILDEAFAHPDARLEQALKPAMITCPNPQMWIVSTAGTPEDSPYLLGKVEGGRVCAESGLTNSIAYFEWSAADDMDPSDINTWRSCMPALGFTVTEAAILSDFRSMTADGNLNEFERAYLNRWKTGLTDPVIPLDVWNSLCDPQSSLQDPVCFAFDVSPDRSWSSIVAAGRNQHDNLHVELVARERGTGWVVQALADLMKRHQARLVCDAVGPAGALLADIEKQQIHVTPLSAKEYSQACGMIYDACVQKRLRHLGSPELVAAIDGGVKRPLGDAWAWSRKNSAVDISPLVAATVALWGHETQGPQSVGVWDLNVIVARLRNEQSPQNEPEERAGGVRFIPL